MTFTVKPESIGKIIGPKGKTIQTIIETSGVKDITLEDDGTVQIESTSIEKNEAARELIMKATAEESKGKGERGSKKKDEDSATKGPPPETGVIYRDCEVVGVHNFGIFVAVLPGYEGLVHVSELDVKRVSLLCTYAYFNHD